MQQVLSEVLQFRGSHYDFGVYQAERLIQTPYMEKRALLKDRRFRQFIIDVKVVRELLAELAPFLLDEIDGLRDTLHLTQEEALLHFGGYYANQRSGCSILIQDDFMVRNYDQEPSTYDGRFVLFQPNDGGYASIGPSMMITGRTDGMNEHGLVIGYNFVNSRQHQDGFVCNMIARIVLETCRTTAEAQVMLQKIPHKHSFNYCLLDASGDSLIVEASPRGIEVRQDIACTNHFNALTKENRYTMADSLRRHKLIEDAAISGVPLADAYQLLNDWDGGIFAQKYSAWDGTIHTAIYEPKKLAAHIALGANRMPLPFQFERWLHGERLVISKIKGELQAKQVFTSQK